MSSYHGTEDILYIPHNVQNFSSFFVKLQIIDYFEVCEIDVMKCVLSLVDLAIFSRDSKKIFAKRSTVLQVPTLRTSNLTKLKQN